MAKNKWGKFNDSIDLKELEKDVKNADVNGGNFPKIPKGTYEVELASLEIKPTKKDGRPMVAFAFKILSGEYKGQRLFENKVIYQTKNDAQMIKSVIGFLESLNSGVIIDFLSYDQFDELMLEIFEAVEGKVEFAVEYDPDAFFKMSIVETFDAA